MTKQKSLWLIFGLLLTVFLAVGAAAQSSVNFDARWSRPAAGGGARQSHSYLVQDISGQWVMGSGSASLNFSADPDFFWAGDFLINRSLYLPVVKK
jgi:hypothetical protein